MARAGDMDAIKWLADRDEGKAIQPSEVSLTGADGAPLKVEHVDSWRALHAED